MCRGFESLLRYQTKHKILVMIDSESNFRDNPHWVMGLLLRCLLVAASFSFLFHSTVPDVSGSSNTWNQFHLTTAAAPVTAALGKSSQTYKNSRNYHDAGGPDPAPETSIFGYAYLSQGLFELAFNHPYSAFVVEHILFRNGYKAIPTRAPPVHFSS